MLCTPSGELWERSTYIDDLVDGTISYARFEPTTAIEVIESGDVAVLRYRSSSGWIERHTVRQVVPS